MFIVNAVPLWEEIMETLLSRISLNWITAPSVTAEMFNWFSKEACEKAQVHASFLPFALMNSSLRQKTERGRNAWAVLKYKRNLRSYTPKNKNITCIALNKTQRNSVLVTS